MFKLFALLIAAILWGVWGVLRLRESEGEQIRQFLEKFSRLGVMNKIAILLVVGHLAIFAGGKHGATNDSDQGSGPLMMPPPVAMLNPRPIPDFYLSAVGTNESFDFSVPVDGEIQTNWMLRGAAADYFHLGIDDWEFPFGSASVSNMVVFANGSVVFPTNTCLAPFSTALGIAPVANWGLLAESNRPSLFWRKVNSDNTLLLTWQNVLLDRQPTNTVSFQVELNPNGNFAFRYDLSGIASDELLTNVVVTADNGNRATLPLFQDGISTILTNGQTVATPFTRDVSSLTFKSADERRCDEFREDFDERLGGEDPYSYPQGSTNTVLEHLFYSGTTNGAFAYPQSSDGVAVLWVSVSGTGSGELIVGSSTVPIRGRVASTSPRLLAAPPPSPSTLGIAVPRGMTCPVYLRGDGTLSVSYDSGDFAFGELPDLSGRHFKGWINFPFVNATVPCIHDYNARQKEVSLPVGSGAGDLTCTWQGTAQIEAENHPPRSALLTGHFSGRATTPVSYTLEHPQYLFGQATYSQTARYCPPPPDDDDDDDEDPSGGGYYDGDDDDDEEHYCWCCFWGSCWEGCGCGCSCTFPGGDDEPEDPPVDPEPEDYDESSTNYPHLTGVLKLRTNPVYTQPIHLTVPDEHRNCCLCPDHASNWVAVVYQSRRLKVVDVATDMDFSRSGESVDVKIAGVSPSSEIGDAEVSFAANGEVCLECSYTTLGVGIEGGYVPNVGSVDLNPLNQCNENFGLPIAVNTNVSSAVGLNLITNVRLPSGNIHLGFANATASFKVWFYDYDRGDYVELANSDGGGSLDLSFAGWKHLVGGSSDSYSPQTPVYITASEAGSATLVYRYWAVIDGKFVEDEARQVITALNPQIRADVDHDGDIDASDVGLQLSGRPFRFWFNEDTVHGDYVGEYSLTSRNSGDSVVNGKYDLVNLFPLELNVAEFRREWGSSASFRLRSGNGNLRFCILNGLSAERITAMQTEDILTRDGEPLSSANLYSLGYAGTNLTEVLSAADSSVLLAVEASDYVFEWSAPTLVVSLNGQEVYSYSIPVSICRVDDMYRWVSLRGAESDPNFAVAFPGSCYEMPDEELSNDYVFFLHGFNVPLDAARDWNRAMFKRFWWSGSRARYCGITWRGDDGAVTAFSYHLNAFNALKTAARLKDLVNSVSGASSKVIMAHSLGNMVACEAIRQGMNVDKYFMLNAAVASECFDSSLQGTTDNISKYVPESWRNYPSGCWCSNWHELFGDSDDRSRLKWEGRFADVANRTEVFNYYSTGDEVLEAGDGITSAFSGAINLRWSTHFSWSFPFLTIDRSYDLTLGRYAWQKQEILKGVDPLVATVEAGWRFDSDPHIDPDDGELWESVCTPAEAQQRLVDGSIVTNSVFGHDVQTFYQTVSTLEDRYRAIAYNVPAISKPMGMTSVNAGFRYSCDLNSDDVSNDGARPNQWGRWHQTYTDRWLHSDIKDMSYYFLYNLINQIIERGGLR